MFSLLLVGCASRSAFFPIGLYDVPAADFPAVAAAGFNTVVGVGTTGELEAAAAHGLKAVASVPATDAAKIQAMNGHRALWAWYLYDEPDMHLVSPERVTRLNAEFHRLSRKPTFLVLMSGAAARGLPRKRK
jgi:hypothetical protein